MLVATNKDQLVLADNAKVHHKYYCPGCRQRVILRRGKYKISHFAHQKGSDCGASEGETVEHLRGKKQIYQWALKKGWQPRLEVYLPSIAQRPDILLKIDGQRVAIEFQCSPLSLERLLERNKGYQQEKIRVWWVLGSPYFRKLGNKKVVQFTQLYHNQFVLLFWDTKAKRLVINQKYWQCSYSKLKFNKKLILCQQISMLKFIQYRSRSRKIKELAITAFNLTGHVLAECPLVCHDLTISWPAMNESIIIWRIGVILILEKFPIFYSWERTSWNKLLFDIGGKNWLRPGCIDPRMICNQVIKQYTLELIRVRIIVKMDNCFVLYRHPQWVDDPQLKVQSEYKKRGA
ncbi:competence protein CoiA [Limosilactobacillus albertensis]|uniref:Competence protein CoiA n=1 Tax=Limosilactobacillus albertensis TaxID=2759752 RepID=A0A839H9R1_9LACO|nr:competence protein CoiA family protein [Limosilactobacillus albertensis]MBB1122412.1 competence protein CoiA [Limosilactobacillus albertensis]MCD7121038.1 competence protein CoiA [Limosilactobacillus albertensis]